MVRIKRLKCENNECIGNGEKTKLHRIKIVVFSLDKCGADSYFITKYVIMTP